MEQVVVGMSDLRTARAPASLVTYALGSCVGVCLWDPVKQVGGIAHVMLPDSKIAIGVPNLAKYADTAVPLLVQRMVEAGARQQNLQAKVAGGAQMFIGADLQDSDFWQIGRRNVKAVSSALGQLHIPVMGWDVLKDYGRSLFFDIASGRLTVRSLSRIDLII